MNIPRTIENYAPSGHYLDAFAKLEPEIAKDLTVHTAVLRHGYVQFVWPSTVVEGEQYHMLGDHQSYCPVFFGGPL